MCLENATCFHVLYVVFIELINYFCILNLINIIIRKFYCSNFFKCVVIFYYGFFLNERIFFNFRIIRSPNLRRIYYGYMYLIDICNKLLFISSLYKQNYNVLPTFNS